MTPKTDPTISVARARELAVNFSLNFCARGGRLDSPEPTLAAYLSKWLHHGIVDAKANRQQNDANLLAILDALRAMAAPVVDTTL
jgi:hypothetical protein